MDKKSILSLNSVYLVQTETTVGFLSQDSSKLAKIKNRPQNKPFLISVDSFKWLKKFSRAPNRFKKFIRRSKKTTFIYPNNRAIRVVKDKRHTLFLNRFGWIYSTSANRSNQKFEKEFATKSVDIIVEDNRGFFEGTPSKIFKLKKNRIKRVR
ncbi:MAG TPA: Sua5 YciO YrdC YwlC family protein [Campylobacterales bacterium]|nr:Sua5 YciO YrdC YwlC family protein [Campylobacterales bacterium]